VANSDGSGRRVIASAADVFMSDVFGVSASPTGRQVVFTAEDRYSTRLYTVDVSPGRHYAAISDDGQDPSWSPTGRRLVLVTSEGASATVDSQPGRVGTAAVPNHARPRSGASVVVTRREANRVHR
jgi:Tol biopolymer transport system component